MITEEDRQFLRYWEQNRENENNFSFKLMKGLPIATMFGLPIILLVIIVRLYFPEWYTKISQTSPGTFLTAIIAVIIIILFSSYFNMQYKWETNEQAYQELKAKEKKEEVAAGLKETDTLKT
jgi:hypothetical protein